MQTIDMEAKTLNPKPDFRGLASKMIMEHVHLNGCPQIVVTRWDNYRWCKLAGYDNTEPGSFGSLDYVVFSAPALDVPLTPVTPELRRFIKAVAKDLGFQLPAKRLAA